MSANDRGPALPLAARMRPRSLDEVVGQRHLLRPGSPLRRLAEADAGPDGGAGAGARGRVAHPVSVILWGPPGTGKTTLAQAVAHSSGRAFVELSAVTAGIADVRRVLAEALAARDLTGATTVLFLDEIHRFTKAQQDALLPAVELGWVTLIAATTENPSFSVITPLLSRSLLLTLEQLTDDDLRTLIRRAAADPRGLDGSVALADDAVEALVRLSSGDARRALTGLEAVAASARALDRGDPSRDVHRGDAADRTDADSDSGSGSDADSDAAPRPPLVTAAMVAAALDRAQLRYDRDGDEHYDVISAFIKSMRGSDPDAAIHYLARMIEAGENPRFIARRLIVHAAEDVGMADPHALILAVAAADAAQEVGLPDARLAFAEAAVHIATAPKSDAVITAIDAAIADVRGGLFGPVPKHLRHAHNRGSKLLGHGVEYRSPHKDPRGVLEQQYLPDALVGRVYYRPTPHGNERAVGERLAKVRRLLRGR